MENNVCAITVIKPDIRLRPYVRYFYILKNHEDIEVSLTFPLGCPQIIFHKKSPLFIPELSVFQDRFTISGQVNFPAHVASLGATEMIVAVFHPHTIGTFIQTPPSAFYNREIAGYDLENSDINELAARIFDTEDNNICVRIIEKWLLHKLASAGSDFYSARMEMAIRILMNDPSEKINSLASKCCLWSETVQARFQCPRRNYAERICAHCEISESSVDASERLYGLQRYSILLRLQRSVSFYT